LIFLCNHFIKVTLSPVSPTRSGRVTESLVAEYSNLFPFKWVKSLNPRAL